MLDIAHRRKGQSRPPDEQDPEPDQKSYDDITGGANIGLEDDGDIFREDLPDLQSYPEILYTAPLQPENQLHIQRRVTDENVLLPHRGLSWCQPLRAQKE